MTLPLNNREKATRITVKKTQLQQNNVEFDSATFIQINMWYSINSWWLSELTEYYPNVSVLYLRLPHTHRWGQLAKHTQIFLSRWMKDGLVLEYQEGWLQTDGSFEIMSMCTITCEQKPANGSLTQ